LAFKRPSHLPVYELSLNAFSGGTDTVTVLYLYIDDMNLFSVIMLAETAGGDNDRGRVDNRSWIQRGLHDAVGQDHGQRRLYGLLRVAGQGHADGGRRVHRVSAVHSAADDARLRLHQDGACVTSTRRDRRGSGSR